MGAHLASVHSANEYQDIQKMIVVANGGFGRTWLGGSDCQTVYHLITTNIQSLFTCYLFIYLFLQFSLLLCLLGGYLVVE